MYVTLLKRIILSHTALLFLLLPFPPQDQVPIKMTTDFNRCDDFLFSQQQETASDTNKYGGLVPKKKPLISKDHNRAFFDSADWALHKQGAQMNHITIAAIEKLRPKLQRTPRKQLPPRRPTFASSHESLADSNF